MIIVSHALIDGVFIAIGQLNTRYAVFTANSLNVKNGNSPDIKDVYVTYNVKEKSCALQHYEQLVKQRSVAKSLKNKSMDEHPVNVTIKRNIFKK